jgi:hypothetical protein
MKRPHVIYCHTHVDSGRKYVGQTRTTMASRWLRHLRDAFARGRTSAFAAAIRQYGPDAFAHEVLAVVCGDDEADTAERQWIAALGTVVPMGFNLEDGGGGRHEETCRKIRDRNLERYAAMSQEEKDSIARRAREGTTPEVRAEGLRRLAASLRERASRMTSEQRKLQVAAARAGARRMTPAQHSERNRRANASQTPEQRSARQKKAAAHLTAEEWSAVMKAQWASLSPESRATHARKARENVPIETRSSAARDWQSTRSPEERSASCRRAWVTRRAKVTP